MYVVVKMRKRESLPYPSLLQVKEGQFSLLAAGAGVSALKAAPSQVEGAEREEGIIPG